MTTEGARTSGPRGYVIGYLTDVRVGPEIFEYIERIESTFEPYGGEWLVHGTKPDVVEGRAPGDVVIIGFPSWDAVQEWWNSAEYRAIAQLRIDNARSVIMLQKGVPDGYRAAETVAKLRQA